MKKKPYLEFKDDILKYKLSLRYLLDNGRRLSKLYQYNKNGCGAKGGHKFPDTIWGVDVQSACHCHDISWHISTKYKDLTDADMQFTHDLKLICDKESANAFMAWLRRLRIATYSFGVDEFGLEDYARKRGF